MTTNIRPSRQPEYQRVYHKQHYQDNKVKYDQQSRAYKQSLQDLAWDAKSRPCHDCGVQYPPWVMQFDHRDPTQKVSNIGQLITTGRKTKLIEEIAKCDVVCANCHAERTYHQMQEKKSLNETERGHS